MSNVTTQGTDAASTAATAPKGKLKASAHAWKYSS